MKDDLLEATIGQSLNISPMSVTFETSQSFRGWLKDEA